jgi:hypothetical protein
VIVFCYYFDLSPLCVAIAAYMGALGTSCVEGFLLLASHLCRKRTYLGTLPSLVAAGGDSNRRRKIKRKTKTNFQISTFDGYFLLR